MMCNICIDINLSLISILHCIALQKKNLHVTIPFKNRYVQGLISQPSRNLNCGLLERAKGNPLLICTYNWLFLQKDYLFRFFFILFTDCVSAMYLSFLSVINIFIFLVCLYRNQSSVTDKMTSE